MEMQPGETVQRGSWFNTSFDWAQEERSECWTEPVHEFSTEIQTRVLYQENSQFSFFGGSGRCLGRVY